MGSQLSTRTNPKPDNQRGGGGLEPEGSELTVLPLEADEEVATIMEEANKSSRTEAWWYIGRRWRGSANKRVHRSSEEGGGPGGR